jgi:hypothetical protein
MIYLLTYKSELRTAKIWQGHLKLLKTALDNLHFSYEELELSELSGALFSGDTVLNIGNHQYCPGEQLEIAGKVLSKTHFIGFIDDWKSPLPTQIRRQVKGILITNIYEPPLHLKSYEWVEKSFYLNLNRASYNLLPLKPIGEGFVYWGSFRPGRIRYFDRYFRNATISASDRAHERFSEYYNYRAIDKLNLPYDLQQFGYTIYFHDDGQPRQSPANRFYESISAGLPIFFDRECISHFGIEIDPWIIDGPKDIKKYELTSVQKAQRKFLCKDYRTELLNDTTKLLGELLCK